MSDPINERPSMSREPDGTDEFARELCKDFIVMTPEQRERRSRMEFPRVDDDRDREIERLTEVFKDAILHAPIPDVNPNLIRTVESQARECALRVVGDAPQAPAEQEGPR